MYKVRLYTKDGDFIREVFVNSMDEAKLIRNDHAMSIGLRPEPSTDFALYPTIWENESGVWTRVIGF